MKSRPLPKLAAARKRLADACDPPSDAKLRLLTDDLRVSPTLFVDEKKTRVGNNCI